VIDGVAFVIDRVIKKITIKTNNNKIKRIAKSDDNADWDNGSCSIKIAVATPKP
jgi:hypothetical protein